jgi:hypothetical protein
MPTALFCPKLTAMSTKDEIRKIPKPYQYNPAKKGDYEVVPATESLPERNKNRVIRGDRKIRD